MTEQEKVTRVRLLFVMLIMSLILAAYSYRTAKAQEHKHGITVPDWYDPECCNLKDCRPVEDETIDFSNNAFGPILVYTKENIKLDFPKSRWRNSKDEHYHVCYRGDVVYCAYLPVKA